MPHCILETSSNVVAPPDMRGVLLQIHETLRATELFALEDIKSRAIVHETAAVADGAANRSFVTLTVEIMDGRSDEVKDAITDALFETLLRSFAHAMETSRCNLTVQIRDIHKASYRRKTGPAGG
jgi:5-carboxymethyl-2-hydroxymuconate isomerase